MNIWPEIVTSFPLTVRAVVNSYTLIPTDASGTFYHYTTHSGIEGILRSGGLRAKYRMGMNDPGEFDYAKALIFDQLEILSKRKDLPAIVQDIAMYSSKNLDKFLDDTTEVSSAYCACLTVSSDDEGLWESYAVNGDGFAIGFDLLRILQMQKPARQQHKPYVYCDPVIYDQQKQCDLVRSLVEAGFDDLQAFAARISKCSDDLTAFRDWVTQEIVVCLMFAIDFIKDPHYCGEQEMRLMLDSNDGTLNASHVQHYSHNGQLIPYIFMDLRNPETGRIPLEEIKIGPKGDFAKQKTFLVNLLDELGYGNHFYDCPKITRALNHDEDQ